MSTLWEKVTKQVRLVTLPDIYLRLKSLLDSENFYMVDVADLISQDPALTARLLRLVNSAYFGFAARIDTVSRAINMLGTQQVHDLALATLVADRFDGIPDHVMNMGRYWRKSVICGIASRELATMCNVLDSERLFVGGLLRDIGHLIMYQTVPEQARQAREIAQQQNLPLFEVERELVGIDYARVGGMLMRQWNLPSSLWEPTECHIEPGAAKETPLFTALVHIGALVADAIDASDKLSDALRLVDAHAWRLSGLDAEQCLGLEQKVDKQIDLVMSLMFPVQRQARA